MFAAGVWSSKVTYCTEAELYDVHNLNTLLSAVRFRGYVADDLRALLDAAAGNFFTCCSV